MTNDNPQPIIDEEVAAVLSEARGHLDSAREELDHLLSTDLLNAKQRELIEQTSDQISEIMGQMYEMAYGAPKAKSGADTLPLDVETAFEEEFDPDDPGMRYLQDR